MADESANQLKRQATKGADILQQTKDNNIFGQRMSEDSEAEEVGKTTTTIPLHQIEEERVQGPLAADQAEAEVPEAEGILFANKQRP